MGAQYTSPSNSQTDSSGINTKYAIKKRKRRKRANERLTVTAVYNLSSRGPSTHRTMDGMSFEY